MRQKTTYLKILGLSLLAALGLMALGAGSAAASTWKIEGAAFAGEESITGTAEEGELLVPGLGLELNCTGAEVKNAKIFESDKALAELLFNGCTVLNNKFCKVYETEMDMELKVNAGHLVASGAGLIFLHKTNAGGVTKHYLLISQEGTAFSTIYFSPASDGCTLPLNNTVNGSTILELESLLTSGLLQTLKPLLDMEIQLLFREELVSTFGAHGDELFYGNEKAELHKGLATVKLNGPNINKNWSGE